MRRVPGAVWLAFLLAAASLAIAAVGDQVPPQQQQSGQPKSAQPRAVKPLATQSQTAPSQSTRTQASKPQATKPQATQPQASKQQTAPSQATKAQVARPQAAQSPAATAAPGQPPYPHGAFREDCALCHRPDSWTPARISVRFDHSRFGFKLDGAHASASCRGCHKSLEFAAAPTACIDCHRDVHQGELGTECSGCHGTQSFVDRGDQVRMHRLTRFPLAGAHTALDCASCHPLAAPGALTYVKTPTTCEACHMKDFRATTNPDHQAAGFTHECTTCHSEASWSRARFDHAGTNFPLTGAHQIVACNSCHTGGTFGALATTCVSCHQADYNNTTNPNHRSGGFPTDCTQCHSTVNWSGATFNHATTGFALTGAHAAAQCSQCHTGSSFSGLSSTCVSCHQGDFNGTTNPDHRAGGFPTDCTQCHSTATWSGATFNHATTGFALTCAHAAAQCATCHAGGVFTGLSPTCVSCHQNDYNGTTNPNHRTAGFPTDCTQCHTTATWTGATFNHATTGFALTGAHTALQCAQCHVGGNYSITSPACVSCHQNDFNSATNPDHRAAGFATDCTQCHSTASWSGASFNHATTGFALTGAHTGLQCAQCHVGGNYNITTSACVSCHQNDFNGTTNPSHQTAGFPTDCTQCHTTATWPGATFNHATTGFALTGAHTTLPCAQCHVGGNYNITSPACVSCHQTDFNGTTNPDHRAAGFPTDCSQCHSTVNWSGASFNHATTGFALTGAHAAAQCAQCHVGGNYTNVSPACVSCHQTDYNGTTDPPHATAGFPTDCSQCHSTATWAGATFDHDAAYFPIYSGRHKGKWDACSTCHTNSANYTVFSCFGCHPHDDQAGTDSHHQGQSGYRYESTSCYRCHPRGNAG
jgi:Zn finger protein HypA/HybF involved in hydrogenase expression